MALNSLLDVARVGLAGLMVLASTHPVPARADDDSDNYGCKVVLCLSNPASNGGPRAPDTCAPAIDKLYHDLAHGRAFPQCAGSGMDVKQVNTPFDPCPGGTAAAQPGAYVVQGQPRTGKRAYGETGFDVTGDPRQSEMGTDRGYIDGPQACVGQVLGTYDMFNSGSYDDAVPVTVYDHIVWQQPQSPRAIDVYQGSQFQQRIHY
jgi:hypothetical protein